ncbi:hypothetical protein [Brachybacterium sp.]|uniref:hypothetical protein n=1 Tax=Brachybacterium sp. TaxID=1891286 RepID=UPI002ECFFBFB
MNTAPPVHESPTPAFRLDAPGSVVWMLLASPFLLAVGTFVTVAMLPFVNTVTAKGDAVLMAWAGAILLCLGLTFLVAGLVILGVRSLMQQQMEMLRGAGVENRGA